MTPALALGLAHVLGLDRNQAWTEIKPGIKHKVFTQEAGAGGVRVGWLELEQSNSASFEMNLLKF